MSSLMCIVFGCPTSNYLFIPVDTVLNVKSYPEWPNQFDFVALSVLQKALHVQYHFSISLQFYKVLFREI